MTWLIDAESARWAAPLYLEMRQALTATSQRTGSVTQKTKPPLRVDVLDWIQRQMS